MSRSLFRVRGSFKLRADSYEAFVKLPISELFDPSVSSEMESNLAGTRKMKSFASSYFRQFDGTLYDYWKHHIDTWAAYEEHNIKHVCYDDLLKDFPGTMRTIAEFLGSDKCDFEDIRARVGWFPPGEGWSDRSEKL